MGIVYGQQNRVHRQGGLGKVRGRSDEKLQGRLMNRRGVHKALSHGLVLMQSTHMPLLVLLKPPHLGHAVLPQSFLASVYLTPGANSS